MTQLMTVGYYTKPQMARLYCCCTKTIEKWSQLGEIPSPIGDRANKKRNRRLWSKAEVDLDLESKGMAPVKETVSPISPALHPHPEQSNLPLLKDNTPETKRCTKCGEEKELDQFHFQNKRLLSRRSFCKDCKKVYDNRFGKAHEERRKNGTQEEWIKSFHPDGTKLCGVCKVARDLSDFSFSNADEDGVRGNCKGCKAFSDATRTGMEKTWKPMKITKEEYLDIYHRDNCIGCGGSNPRGVDRIDSSKPYTIENTQELCFLCNTAKLDRTMSEWLDHTRQILEHQEKLKKCELT